jgi:hypothetical protein
MAAPQTLTTAGMSTFLRNKASSVDATPVAHIPNVCPAVACGLTLGRLSPSSARFFATGATRPLSFRKDQMCKLYYLIDDNQDAFLEVVAADFAKPLQEVVAEFGLTLQDIVHVSKNVLSAIRNIRSP